MPRTNRSKSGKQLNKRRVRQAVRSSDKFTARRIRAAVTLNILKTNALKLLLMQKKRFIYKRNVAGSQSGARNVNLRNVFRGVSIR